MGRGTTKWWRGLRFQIAHSMKCQHSPSCFAIHPAPGGEPCTVLRYYDAKYDATDTVPLVVPFAVPVIEPDALPLTVALDNVALVVAVPTALDPHVVIAGIVPVAVPLTEPVIVALLNVPDTAALLNVPAVVAVLTVATTPLCVA